MSLAMRSIIKDVNDILDKTDKTIFALAGCQQIIFLIIVIVDYSVPFFSFLRILRIIQDVLILNCFIKLQIENEIYLKYFDRVTKAFIVALILIGIMISVTIGINTKYNCAQDLWIIFSLINFIIVIGQLYIGLQLLYLIHNYWKDQQNQTVFDGLSKITMDELKNRQTQISSFIIIGILSAATMLFWDYQTGQVFIFCIDVNSFKSMIIITSLILLQYQLPSAGIYYIYYIKNKKYFNSHNWQYQKNLANFYDDRSEIPLMDM